MEKLDFYNTLLANTTSTNPQKNVDLEEEVDIVIHKLKFIPKESRPSVLVLDQATFYEPKSSPQLTDTISISGGNLLSEKFDNPSKLVFIQHSGDLFADIISVLDDVILRRTDAVQKNEVYIINKPDFGNDPEDFLGDVEIAAEIIQPKYFVYGRQGIDWVKFDLLA